MLSIAEIKPGVDYHHYLVDDYYLDGELGGWLGTGARALGLTGRVTREQFQALRSGFDVDGEKLVKNAGSKDHQIGWDLTFSAPKGLSIIWSQAPKELRNRIRKLHFRAVKEALSYLEDTAASIRIGKGGRRRRKCGLVFATFNHSTSRELDPDVHTHCICFNVGVTDDGRTGAIVSKDLYLEKMTAGALYRASLAEAIERELGIRVKNNGRTWEVEGVPDRLIKVQSKRRSQILNQLGQGSDHSAAASSRATQETKQAKVTVPESELFSGWQATNRKHGFTEQTVSDLCGRFVERAPYREVAMIVRESLERITEQQNYFSRRDLIREMAYRSAGRGVTAAVIREAATAVLQNKDAVVRLEGYQGERFTTPKMLELEAKFIQLVEQSKTNSSHVLNAKHVERKLDRSLPLNDTLSADDRIRNTQQREAVRHLTTNPGSFQVLTGIAGSGKTTTLRICRELWEEAGYQVTGMALAGKAGRELEKGSEIESETLALRVKQLEDPVGDRLRHEARQLARALKGQWTYAYEGWKLDSRTVVVLDEAGMVGTKQFSIIVEAVTRAGAKLVVAGDEKQLQPIEAGAPLAQMTEQVGQTKLTHITRQRLQEHDKNPRWARQAVEHFAEGRAEEGLKLFAERKLLTVAKDRGDAMRKLVGDWQKAGGHVEPEKHIILTSTNVEARTINQLCQKARLAAEPATPKEKAIRNDGEVFLPGDRVLFTKKSRKLDLDNGDLGTVTGIGGTARARVMTVKMDDARIVHVPVNDFQKFRLGFAATTHKAQGGTYERAYVLAGGSMQDLHSTYVQASRARETTRFYTSRLEAGKELEGLVKQMETDRSNVMATSYLHDKRKRRRPTTSEEVKVTVNEELSRELRKTLSTDQDRKQTKERRREIER
jgi:conjugative relaxase-like TrwC/TraI family protein